MRKTASIPPLVKSACILLCRQISPKLQVLLMERKPHISFGSMWVSPGGICDPPDKVRNNFLDYGGFTALRETFEETGLFIVPEGHKVNVDTLPKSEEELNRELIKIWLNYDIREYLLPVIRLMTIQVPMKRYDTLFYILNSNVKILNLKLYTHTKQPQSLDNLDSLRINEESVRYEWRQPSNFLERFYKGEINLMPPQVVILSALSHVGGLKELREYTRKMEVRPIMMAQLKGSKVTYVLPEDQDYNLEQTITKEPDSESKTEFMSSYPDKKPQCYNRFTFSPSGIIDYKLDSHSYDLLHLIPRTPNL